MRIQRTTLLVIIYLFKGNGADGAQVVVHPEHRNVSIGENAMLQCIFDTEVTCDWHHNGHQIALVVNKQPKHALFGNSNGINVRDCTLIINPVAEKDAGNWSCSSHGTDYHKSISSNVGVVTIKKEMRNSIPQMTSTTKVPEVNAKNIDLKEMVGSGAQFACKMKEGAECIWKRRNQRINIAGRYKYASEQRLNCDLSIFGVSLLDFGKWTCVIWANDQQEPISSSFTLSNGDSSVFSSNTAWIVSSVAVIIVSSCAVLLLIYKLRH